MVIFINDKPIKFVKKNSEIDKKHFDTVIIDIKKIKNLKDWKKKVLIPIGTEAMITAFISAIKEVKKFDFKSLTFIVEDIEIARSTVYKQYKIVDAAGGVILNDKGEVLMIHRLGKWDLPKGKAEPSETIKETAIREVEEECCITVEATDNHLISYHTYLHKNQRVLKRTFWYQMYLVSDENMKPQLEEGIDFICWKNRNQMAKALKESYASIKYVLEHSLSQELSFSK